MIFNSFLCNSYYTFMSSIYMLLMYCIHITITFYERWYCTFKMEKIQFISFIFYSLMKKVFFGKMALIVN